MTSFFILKQWQESQAHVEAYSMPSVSDYNIDILSTESVGIMVDGIHSKLMAYPL